MSELGERIIKATLVRVNRNKPTTSKKDGGKPCYLSDIEFNGTKIGLVHLPFVVEQSTDINGEVTETKLPYGTKVDVKVRWYNEEPYFTILGPARAARITKADFLALLDTDEAVAAADTVDESITE